jgi:hypothetical protein
LRAAIVVLLACGPFNSGRLFVADHDVQSGSLRRNREIPVAQLPDEIEGFSRWLFVRETHRVFLNCLLYGRANVRRGLEEAVRGNKPAQRLVRPLKVVGLNEQAETTVAIRIIRKHSSRQEFVPKCFPKALHLAERLRVLRPTLDVPNSVLAKNSFEVGFAAPRGVLAALVGEDFFWFSPRGNPSRKRLHHELGTLVVRERVGHDEPRVVVHERREIKPLLATKQERKNVRLPHLIGLRALEAARRMLTSGYRLRLN